YQQNMPTMSDTGNLSAARSLHQSRRIVLTPSCQEATVGTKGDQMEHAGMFYVGHPTRCDFQKPRCSVTDCYEEPAVRTEGDRIYRISVVDPANFPTADGIHQAHAVVFADRRNKPSVETKEDVRNLSAVPDESDLFSANDIH